jgi:hypothetical protein
MYSHLNKISEHHNPPQDFPLRSGTNEEQYHSRFQAECLTASSISLNVYSTGIDFLEDTRDWEVQEALGFDISRFWQSKRPHNFGAMACFRNEDGSLWQGKPEHPTQDSTGKLNKYIAPKGQGSRAYLPALPPALHQSIGAPLDASFWDWIAANPDQPVIITEGGKKSLAALSLGYTALSLYGISAGVSKYETVGGERLRKLTPSLIPDLQRFAVPGRRFILAFDQDAAATTRRKVNAAQADLSFWLEQSGCEVQIAIWDGQNGTAKGLDDLITSQGATAWHEAYAHAIPAPQWRIQQDLSNQVKRQPDLTIGNQEFSEALDKIPTTGLVILSGGKGSGKSKAIGAMIQGQSWLSSTPLISLGRDQAEGWDGVFLNDGDIIGNQLLRDGAPVNGASVCIPSLLKVQRINPYALIVDETTTHLGFLLNSPLANKGGIRPLLISEHHRQAQAAELVILADADLTEETIAYYEALTGNQAFLVKSTRQTLTYEATILEGTQNEAIAALQRRLSTLEPGKLIYLNTDSKGLADRLEKLLDGMGYKSLLITSETSGGEAQKRFLGSKGTEIMALVSQNIQAVISSPTIAQGFSIEHHTDCIDSVWGFYKGVSIPAQGIAQSLDRVRSAQVPRFVSLSKKGTAFSKLSQAQSVSTFLKEFRQVQTATARLVRHLLSPETVLATDKTDWQNKNLSMLASLEVRRNRGMKALRETVIALLCQEGKQVQVLKPMVTKAEARAAGQALKAGAQAIQQAHAQAVAVAASLTETEAAHLSNQTEALTPDQVLSLEKYYLSQFYRCDVDTDLVGFDRNSSTRREVRNLERILNPQLATDQTAATINQNPNSPQDWSKAAVQDWLGQTSGANELIRRIVTGGVETLTSDITAPIAQFIRAHQQEFRMGFGFTKLGQVSDQQIIGQLLSRVGIRTKRNRRKGTYTVQKPRLEALLEIIERRRKADPPPEIKETNQTGWIGDRPNETGLSSPQSHRGTPSSRPSSIPRISKGEFLDGSGVA